MTDQILNQIKAYKKFLQSKMPVDQVIIFGSQTKDTTHPDSDIDVAVVSKEFGQDYHRELIDLGILTNQFSLDIEAHPFHPKDLDNKYDTLASEIKKHGIPV